MPYIRILFAKNTTYRHPLFEGHNLLNYFIFQYKEEGAFRPCSQNIQAGFTIGVIAAGMGLRYSTEKEKEKMAYWYRPIVNSDLIGEKMTIQLPGFPGGKAEKCSIHYLTLGEGEPLLLVHSLGQSI